MKANSMKFSREILKEVSRSFALTIPMLDKEIKDEVLLTYLQDRILDNFEDEINPADIEFQKKMMDKVTHIFSPEDYDRSTDFEIIKEKSSMIEKKSLQKLNKNIEKIFEVYKSFDPKVKEISHKWLVEMNDGMQKYLDKKVGTFAELDEYCYYVAGTVGGFLTELIIYKKILKVIEKKF
jgi:farnesyl-diphosphate farnesyltransferase